MTEMTTLRKNKITKAAILSAIAECKTLGREAFLSKYGFKASRTCSMVIDGEAYDSKAIVGVAAGLAAADFSGGKATVGRVLRTLGFKLGVLLFARAAKGILDAAHEAFKKQVGDKVLLKAWYYPSGSNRVGHILGFARIGQPFMVCAPEVTEAAEDALYEVAAEYPELEIAIDSGAYKRSIANFPTKSGKLPHPDRAIGWHCDNPISDAEWQDIFNLYHRLAAVYGRRLMVVAPDQVGFQKETLDLVKKYREDIRKLIAAGCKVMVVSQKGELDQVAFDAEIERILGTNDYVRALPCAKNATSVAEIKAFAAARRPRHLHLLGMGLRSPNAPKAAKAVLSASSATRLSYDSCLINESVGKSNGRSNHPAEVKGGPRVLEAAKAKARELFGFVKGSEDPAYHAEAIRLAWGATA
jgi:hypothetical protein